MISDECPVCLDAVESTLCVRSPCSHTICLKCFTKLNPLRCPLCRDDFTEYIPGRDRPFILGRLNELHLDDSDDAVYIVTRRPVQRESIVGLTPIHRATTLNLPVTPLERSSAATNHPVVHSGRFQRLRRIVYRIEPERHLG